MVTLEPQDALERAVCDAILAGGAPGGGEYPQSQVKQMFDGQPEPRMGQRFISVWHDGRRRSEMRTCLNEVFEVHVTLTVRCTQPFDRWLIHRQDMERRLNAIAALIHADSLDFRISRAASRLAGYDGPGQPVGFREALAFDGFDPIEVQGPSWFAAEAEASRVDEGLSQRARFRMSRRVQALATMS
jgi:hypothetical protein